MTSERHVSTPEIVWEDPPQAANRLHPTRGILDAIPALKERPWSWARVYTGGSSGVDTRARLLREAGCETTTSRADGGTRHLYARWIGV